MSTFVLDPKGYFLIRVSDKVEIAFLEYTKEQLKGGFSKNDIKENFSSNNYDELLNWSKKRITRKDHLEYMEKEVKKALDCLKNNKEYIQP